MAIVCTSCAPNKTFSTQSTYRLHCTRLHSARNITNRHSTFRYHPHLKGELKYCTFSQLIYREYVGLPCTEDGQFLPRNSVSPPRDSSHDWTPFASRSAFELAELVFETEKMSEGRATDFLRIWTAHWIEMGHFTEAPYHDYNDLTATIDSIELGDATWEAFTVRYGGLVDEDSSTWEREAYTVYARNILTAMRSILENPDYDGSFEYSPYREYVGPEARRWSNLMSGDWAWDKAVRALLTSFWLVDQT